ncbi:hypothetical protein GCM10008955_30490 [Deinococcus malanensis]|uniref:Uncharacterized protein n=1 Tax=Deinococcus malanensis TaxID=1706855 RepID=A0ABQ2F2W2_9DEIO|nr:hypothetical protein [Deinococcus malanensis]GGK34391.1 hypothetical protein GCM10008955_30490 [Deinococcus malanensis]
MTDHLDRVRDVLAVTRVMTATQAGRLASLDLPELHRSGLVMMPMGVNLRHQGKHSRRQIQMVATRDLRGRLRGTDMLHTCGALELVLGAVPLDEFDPAALTMPSKTPEGERPDLEYRHPPGELMAAEFDTGAYKLTAMHSKLKRFTREYDAVVYGTTVPRRHQNLTRAVLEGLGCGSLSLHHVLSLD